MRRREFLAWAAVGGIGACGDRGSDGQATNAAGALPTRTTARSAPGAAIAIGVNGVDHTKYLTWGDKLCGAEGDAQRFSDFLRGRHFKIVADPLLGATASRQAVADAIQSVAEHTAAGQTACIYFSGHGAQAKSSLTAQLDPHDSDGVDQSWCLNDGPLFDNELYWLLDKFEPGRKVLVVSDSCYGGGMYALDLAIAAMDRSVKLLDGQVAPCKPPRVRSMPTDIGEELYRRWAASAPDLKRDPPPASARVDAIVFAAAARKDLAYEVDGHGVFTDALIAIAGAAGCKLTYAKVLEQVATKIGGYSRPVQRSLQNPHLDDWFSNDIAFCAG